MITEETYEGDITLQIYNGREHERQCGTIPDKGEVVF